MLTPRLYAGVFGTIYLVVGIAAYAVMGVSMQTSTFIIFDLNAAHNLVHLVLGGTGLAAFAGGAGPSRLYGRVVGVVLVVVAIAGFAPQPFLGIIPIGGVDIVLHGLSGLLGLYVGFLIPAAEDVETTPV